jgi:hypothetical protein
MRKVLTHFGLLFIALFFYSCQKTSTPPITYTLEQAHQLANQGILGIEADNPAVILVFDENSQLVSVEDFHKQKFTATNWTYKVCDLKSYQKLNPTDPCATSFYALPYSANDKGQMIFVYDAYAEHKISREELESRWAKAERETKYYRFADTKRGDLFVQYACNGCPGGSLVGHVAMISDGTTLAAQGNNRNNLYFNSWIRHAWNAGTGYCGGNYAGGVRSNRLSEIWGCLKDAPNNANNRHHRYKNINATMETNLRNFLLAENGKAYNLFAVRSWNPNVRPATYNCSLLCWQAYFNCTYANTQYGPTYISIDLNYSNSATVVLPNNIYNNSTHFNIQAMP